MPKTDAGPRPASGSRSRGRRAICLFLLAGLSYSDAAVLKGVVLDNRTGRPLARAKVAIEGVRKTGSGVNLQLFTDRSGEFAVSALPAGAYLVSASRRGYAAVRFGQRSWKAPGTPVVLDRDGDFYAQLRLRRLGVVTGEVLDDNGASLPNCPVYAYRAGPKLKMVAGGETDDRGVFRLPFLEPGRYYIRTGPRQFEDGQGALPTYYGQTTQSYQARALELGLDQEISGVVIEPIPGALSSLTVQVTNAAARVTLYADTGKHEAQLPAGGEHTFTELAPGMYDLIAESTDSAEPLAAHRRISIGRPGERTALELAAAPRLVVRCEERYGKALDPRSLNIFVRRKEPPQDTSQRISCGVPSVLPPGRWEFAAVPPPEMYVYSVSARQRTENAYEVQLSTGTYVVAVTFSSKPAHLSGKVKMADGAPAIGAPVYLTPLDGETRSRLGGVPSVRSDQNGEFRFPNVPPGRYELVSSFQVQDSGEDGWSPGRGIGVTLEEGSEKSCDLTLTEL
ncbi:MAG: carboxypeptidase regulatory-like domain-containing protein [Acidobacteria bacterium]|nr:carboxypeptidase regulatory-like domain-containing protein [Acidobacteriota bacterium]